MQIIKIFLASSSELNEEREQFEIAINRKNNEWVKNEVFLELIIWENAIDHIVPDGLQEEYNKLVKECDIFVMFFSTKVGKFTNEEFENAFTTYKENQRPYIYIYFIDKGKISSETPWKDLKSVDSFKKKIESLGHYLKVTKNFEEVRSKFFDQLNKLTNTGFIKIEKTSVHIKEKVLYIKLHHLKEKKEAAMPFYTKFIQRTNTEEEVFDEAQFFELVIYSNPGNIDISNHTDGTVDMDILVPWEKLSLEDEGDTETKGKIFQKINLPSNVFFSSANFINGFQKSKTQYSSKAYINTESLRIIVDFSSLKNYQQLHKSCPNAIRKDFKKKVEIPEKIDELRRGVFHVQAQNLKEGDKVQINFDIDWVNMSE